MVKKEENNHSNAILVDTDGRIQEIIKKILQNIIMIGYLAEEHCQRLVII